MSTDLKDPKYRHDLKAAVRTFQLFLEFVKDNPVSENDASFQDICSQVEEAHQFLERHIEQLYES